MHSNGTSFTEKDFEELLSAAWAAQSASARARQIRADCQTDPDSQKRPGNKETSDEHETR